MPGPAHRSCALAHSARGVDDYVADLLFNEIRPETLRAFRDDESFLSAYHYPARDQKT